MAFNHTGLLGRLAQNPEITYTDGGVPRCAFDLAVPVPSKDRDTPPDYIPIVCWRDQAEFVARYLTKGRQVVVEGHITARKYTTQDGQRRKAVEVVADRIHFADSGSNRDGGGAGDYGTPSR